MALLLGRPEQKSVLCIYWPQVPVFQSPAWPGEGECLRATKLWRLWHKTIKVRQTIFQFRLGKQPDILCFTLVVILGMNFAKFDRDQAKFQTSLYLPMHWCGHDHFSKFYYQKFPMFHTGWHSRYCQVNTTSVGFLNKSSDFFGANVRLA